MPKIKENTNDRILFKTITETTHILQNAEVTAPLLQELIDHIDVYEAEGTGKNKTQRIVIYYRFVGYLEIPEISKTSYKADTRQGVAVEYLTDKKTA